MVPRALGPLLYLPPEILERGSKMPVSRPDGEPALDPARDPLLPAGEMFRPTARCSPSPRLVLLSLIFLTN